MTTEQKVCQLFFVTPESIASMPTATKVSARLRATLQRFPVGGLILFADHCKSESQVRRLTSDLQACASGGVGFFIGTDEEGGGVSRAINKLGLRKAPSPSDLTDADSAFAAASLIGEQLAALGFNLDFAPVADVRTDLDDTEINARSFGYDAAHVAQMTAAFVRGLTDTGVISVLKHFPGHGSAVGNSHTGKAVSTRTADQWRACEWLPFQAGVAANAEVVLVSHLTAAVVDHASPACLSRVIVTELLRGELGFDGVVITDGLRMDAISKSYASGEACVLALEAGVDMLLLPKNFSNAYDGVIGALENGRLTVERIDESVRRILRLKASHGLLVE